MGKLLLICTLLMSLFGNKTLEPDSSIHSLLQEEKYYESIKILSVELKAWEEYTKQTGNYAEGAAGYLYGSVMDAIASKGDKDWGRILDDPTIHYHLKTKMVFEILELRLGKGAVYFLDKENYVVPVFQPIDFKKEKNREQKR